MVGTPMISKLQGKRAALALTHARWPSDAGFSSHDAANTRACIFCPGLEKHFQVLVVRSHVTWPSSQQKRVEYVREHGTVLVHWEGIGGIIEAPRLHHQCIPLCEIMQSTIILREDSASCFTVMAVVVFADGDHGNLSATISAAAADLPFVWREAEAAMLVGRRGPRFRMFGTRHATRNQCMTYERFGWFRTKDEESAFALAHQLLDPDVTHRGGFGEHVYRTINNTLKAVGLISPRAMQRLEQQAHSVGGYPPVVPWLSALPPQPVHAIGISKGLRNEIHTDGGMPSSSADQEMIVWNSDNIGSNNGCVASTSTHAVPAHFAMPEAHSAIRFRRGVPTLAIMPSAMLHGTPVTDPKLYGMVVIGNKNWGLNTLAAMHRVNKQVDELPADEKWRALTTDFALLL